ncbi:MAG TPA: hypothetical protein VH496_17665 [Mycobacterium sp.]|jgi:hypothetical protein
MDAIGILGWVFIGIVAAGVLVGVLFGLTSIPDAVRYMKIRRM